MNPTKTPLRRIILLFLTLLLSFGVAACGEDGEQGEQGPEGPEGPEGPPGPPGEVADVSTSVEACTGCHAAGMNRPVGDITDMDYVHYIDATSDGEMTPAGIRRLEVTITQVDVTNGAVEIEFDVDDENGAYDQIFVSDGRFTIAKLLDGPEAGDATRYQSLIQRTEDPGDVGDGPGDPEQQATYERFTSGTFTNNNDGTYSYVSAFDPTTSSFPVAGDETMRVAIQLSAGDIPPGNGWCDFQTDVGLNFANDCNSAVADTRDIVQTDTCNDCHGPTDDTQLGIHGGGRTDVEYCVTCHNPGTTDANSGNSVDMTVMVHKIHAGSALANGYKIWGFRDSLHDYSEVNFTKELGDCTVCHTGGGADEDAWYNIATREACGACHDDVNFDVAGEGHPVGTIGNELCNNCHVRPGEPVDIREVHKGEYRAIEAGLYAGDFAPFEPNGFRIEDVAFDSGSDELTIDFSVVRDGVFMDLEDDPEWNAGSTSRLAIAVGWNADEYTNEDSGSTPGLPISVSVFDQNNELTPEITDNMNGTYTTVVDLPSAASDTVTVLMEGHPAATLDTTSTNPPYQWRIPVYNTFEHVQVGSSRLPEGERRDVVDVTKCNGCHDSGNVGISVHGNNRTGEIQSCVLCHTADSTDINRRPDDPADTADGKVEETIDFKRMIHQIHMGSDLENDIVVWGFGFPGTEHDFSNVNFIGNMGNCETCHLPGTYGTEQARAALATTIDTGTDAADPSDDLNISQTASVCSSCHDSAVSKDHMLLHGASFQALDEDIH